MKSTARPKSRFKSDLFCFWLLALTVLWSALTVPTANAAPGITVSSPISVSGPATYTNVTGVSISGCTTCQVNLDISNQPTSAGMRFTSSISGLTVRAGYSLAADTVFTSTSFYGSLANVNAAFSRFQYYTGVGGVRHQSRLLFLNTTRMSFCTKATITSRFRHLIPRGIKPTPPHPRERIKG